MLDHMKPDQGTTEVKSFQQLLSMIGAEGFNSRDASFQLNGNKFRLDL